MVAGAALQLLTINEPAALRASNGSTVFFREVEVIAQQLVNLEALAVLDRLEAGEDWSDLASELSQDTSNKDMGGDLGWFGHDRMVPPFEEAAYALEFGEISDPVATDFGYHIIQLLGKETKPMSASTFQAKQQQFFTEWLTEATSTDTVERYDDLWMIVVPTEPALQYQVNP